MENIIINPVSIVTNSFRDENVKTLLFSFVYLHGKLMDLNGYDLAGIVTDKSDFELETDVYPVTVIGVDKPCTLFYWKANGIQRGLIVLNEDTDRLVDALNKYKEKVFVL